MIKIFDMPKILWSENNCIIETKDWGRLPLIVDSFCNVIDPPSDWLIFLRTQNGRSNNTISQYASSLRLYWDFLNNNSLNWIAISDSHLKLWRNNLLNICEAATVNGHLCVVTSFYQWAQENLLVNNIIGETLPNHAPYPIRLVKKGRRGKLCNSLLLKEVRKPKSPIPTESEVDLMFERLSSGVSRPESIRNCLLANWILITGLRRAEVLSLKINQIPNLHKCYEYEAEDKLFKLKIMGKGNVLRVISITSELLIKTREFINQTRPELFPKSMLRNESQHIFISSKNGKVLSNTVVSRMFSEALKNGKSKLTMHRLRARFASKLVQSFLIAELQNSAIYEVIVSTALHKAAEILGHKSIETLYPYLNLALDMLDSEIATHLRKASGGVLKVSSKLV